MINFLRKLFIKNYQDVNDAKVRQEHGKLAAFVGIVSNAFLFLIKLIIGILTNLVSIISDSINNLSDMASSLITLFGFKMSQKPADKEHPYGHERFEYVSGLVVAVLIIVIGIELIINSLKDFIASLDSTPTQMSLTFFIVTVVILSISIVAKLWQGMFNKKIGKLINSLSLEATAQDSRNDVITTSSVLLATIICYIFPSITIAGKNIDIDAIMGILVAIFIIISGIGLIKDTIDPLIGVGPQSDFVKNIVNDIEAHEEVLGVHDIICHMYGPTKCFMSIHVEVDARQNIMDCHDVIDNIEQEIKMKHHVEIVIHMDPVDTQNEELNHYREIVKDKLANISNDLSFHDFRMVAGPTHTNVIFDIVVPYGFKMSNQEIKDAIQEEFNKQEKTIYVVIEFDNEYTER